MKQVFKLLAVLAITGLAVFALAQNTIGGTTISNTATATFTDSGGQSRTTQSNTVTTTVQTVYSFNVETDDSRNPAATPNFTGYSETDGINDKDANAGATVSFAYTVTNNTNNDNITTDGDPVDQIPVTLTIVQDTADNFDLTGVAINVYTFTDTNANGIYDEGTDTLGATPVATGTTSVTYNFQNQSDRIAVIVTGTVPSTRNGNDSALIDLRATNDDATVDNTAAGANVYYENQNVARVEVNEVVLLGAAKSAAVVNNGDGTYAVTYTINLENFGNVPLSGVQVPDTLPFTAAQIVTGPTVGVSATGTGSALTANSSYNGTTNTNLLSGANTLGLAGTGTITINVTVRPGSNLGPYNNQVTASGTSPDGITDTDVSDSGTDPDPDGDGNPDETGEGDTTPVTFVEDRGLGLALDMSAPTPVAGQPGIFETTLTYTIQNLSDATNGTDLCNIQITQNLNQVFPSPSSVTSVGDPTLVSSDDTRVTSSAMNTGFDGGTTQNVLTTGSGVCLGRGDEAVITVVVRFDPNGVTDPFVAQATATGTTPQGTTLTDLSDEGTNPDQDGDGKGNEQATPYDLDRDGTIEDLVVGAPTPDEGLVPDLGGTGTNANSNGNGTTTSENDPTDITVSDTGALGVAKRVVSITPLTGANLGQFDVVFEFNLENFGNVNLTNVQVTDALQTELGTTASLISVTTPVVSNVSSGSSLTANPATPVSVTSPFNGNGKNNLLSTSAGNLLRPGGTGRITLTARIDPNGVAALTNSATATGTTPGGTSVTDDSTDGADPDGTDGDNTPDENTDTPITIPETNELGVALAAATPVNNGNGTYTITYTVTVENLGNVDLTNVQVTLPMTTGTTPFTATQVESATITGTTGGLTAGAGYTGEGVNTLLSGTNGLTVGSSGTITIQVVVRPGTTLGTSTTPYQHNATGTATSPAGPAGNTTDVSQNGADTDPDNAVNSEANDDSVPTPVFFTETPRLGVAKAATAATDASGFPGQFTTTLTFLIENLGDVPLSTVQATDNLNTTFGAGNYTVTSVAGTGSNAGFNGNTNQNLLAAAQTLAVDARITVTVGVRFNPAGQASPLNNTAVATATSPGSSTAGNVTDTSTNGNDTDPDTAGTNPADNTDASDDSVVTPITFTERPSVGIAKAATLLNANTDSNNNTAGPFSVRFDYTLVNLGNVALTNIAITEDLAGQLGGATNYTITSAPSVTTAPTNGASSIILNNPAFDGNATTALLGTGSTLAVNDSAVLSVTVTITNAGAYTNQVTATANGPAGRGSTTDTSDNGTDPDANDDGDGADAPESDPTPINLDAVRLLKSARVCADATCATVTDATGASVRPGQYIEYTIVASNLGGQAVTSVVVTDPIPAPSRYMTSINETAGIICSTAGAAGPFAACPATTATGSTTVTHVRFGSVGLSANDNAAGGADQTTVRFVVYVP